MNNQVTDLLGITNGKKLRTKRVTAQLKRVVQDLFEASDTGAGSVDDHFRFSQRRLGQGGGEVDIQDFLHASGECSMSTYAMVSLLTYVAAGKGMANRSSLQTSVPLSVVRRRARGVLATILKEVIKADTFFECTVGEISEDTLQLQIEVNSIGWPRVNAEMVKQAHWTFSRIFPADTAWMGMSEMMVLAASFSTGKRSPRVKKAALCLLASLNDVVCAAVEYGKNRGAPWTSSGAVNIPDRMSATRRIQRSPC